MVRNVRRWMPLTFAVGLATTGFAFMAANTVPATNAGTGETPISGYTVSGVSYKLKAVPGDPEDVLNVSFKLAAVNKPSPAPAPNVAVQLWQNGPSYSCSSTNWSTTAGSGTFTCATAGVEVKQLTELTVVAAQ